MVEDELMADPVQLVGCHARRYVPAYLGKGLGGDSPGDPHAVDGLGILDVTLAEPRGAAADVLGPGDVGGDVALRRNPAGLEGSRHDLEF
jgi:hypothetical protein